MSSAPRPARLAPLLPLALALATVATAPVAQSEWAPPVRAAPAAPVARAAPGDDLASLNDRARAALEKNQPGEAVELLEKALKLDPTQPVIRGNLAWAYFKRGQQSLADYRLDQAGADYKKAVELNPDESGYAMHLGQLLLRRYRLEEAEKVVRTLLERHPDALDGWLLLGDISSLQDDLPGAQQAYEKAAASSDAELAALARTAADRTARQYAVEKDYRTDTTPFFIIRGPSQSKGPLMSVRLANVLDRSRAEVCASLNVSPQRRATVVLYRPTPSARSPARTTGWAACSTARSACRSTTSSATCPSSSPPSGTSSRTSSCRSSRRAARCSSTRGWPTSWAKAAARAWPSWPPTSTRTVSRATPCRA